MNLRFVSTGIVEEIERKISNAAERYPLTWDSIFSRCYRKFLEREANLHSYKIEYPNGPGTTRYNTHASRRAIRKGVRDLSNAFRWGLENFDPENINEKFIKILAGKIDPEYYDNRPAEYREMGTSISGASWTPPYPAKISIEMPSFLLEIKQLLTRNGIVSALEASAHSHLHLIRIHPFEDTNGRVGRTLQNIILKSAGLPPPVIHTGERRDYYDRLDRAINNWKQRMGTNPNVEPEPKDERVFYNFIAGRVSSALDRLA